jgi:hypothetical protein
MRLFVDLITAGDCEAEAVKHIQPARWAKNMFNGAFSTLVRFFFCLFCHTRLQ